MSVEAARLSVVVDADTGRAESGLVRMGGVVSGAGRRLAGLAAVGIGATAAIGVGLAKAGTSLQDALVPIGTLLGSTTPQFAELSAAVSTFAANSPQSADEIGLAAYTTLSAGITGTKNVMDALSASQQLAEAGLGSMADATDLVTSAINSFKGEGLTAQQAAEQFFAAISAGKTTTEGLAQGFGSIAPLAASAGVSFHALLAATAAMTSTGMEASVAYSGIRGALSNVLKPTKEAAIAADELGLNFSATHLAAVGLPRFLDEIRVATGGNVETMSQLFGSVEGLNAALALTGPQAQAFGMNVWAMDAAGSKLSERAKEVESTWSNRWREMKNKVGIHAGQIGLKVADWLQPKVAQFIDWWKGKWPTIHRVAGEVADRIRDVAVFVATEVFSRIVTGARAVVAWFQRTWPQVRDVVRGVFDWFGTHVVPVVQRVVGYIIGYVGDLIGWWRKNWPAISEAVRHVMNVVRGVIERVLGFIEALWRNYGDRILGALRGVVQTIRGIVQSVMAWIKGVIEFWMAIINGDWGKAWDAVKSMVSGIWDGIWRVVSGSIETVRNVLAGFGRLLGTVLAEGWDKLKSGASSAFDAVVGWVRQLPGKVFDGVKALPGLMLAAGKNVLVFFWNGMIESKNRLMAWLSELPGKILAVFKDAATWLFDAGRRIITGLIDGIKSAIGGVKDTLTGLGSSIIRWKGPPEHDSVMLIDNGRRIMAGLRQGLVDGIPPIHATLTGVTQSLPAAIAARGTVRGGGPVHIVMHIHASSYGEGRAAGRGAREELARFERLNGPQFARAS